MTSPNNLLSRPPQGIAVIGMAGRFPGARNVDQYWQNLCDGVESITELSDEELLAHGVPPELVADPSYVKSRGVLDNIDRFDAGFFGYSPTEATYMDPQQRVFLECAWEAVESAGYDPPRYAGRVGVYAGAKLNAYLYFNLHANYEDVWTIENFMPFVGNQVEYLTSRVAYKLGLEGPAVAVQSACSTSLVAIHMASQALLAGEVDMALAGGVCINLPQECGYRCQVGSMLAPQRHCRAFDAAADGTKPGNGAGVVLLKRLDEALRDGDQVLGVILGTAANNDGSRKAGYTAPSPDGQAEAVARALRAADVDPASITYVEAHGTGTPLGDPTELTGLTKAFRQGTRQRGYCAVGSVKPNIGHLEMASGVAGLIKAVLALHHAAIPPTLHFERPNPKFDFAKSPFYVNTALTPWRTDGRPRRASVSAFGFGGTNAHVIIEESPAIEPSGPSRPLQVLPLSAKTETALATMTTNLREHLIHHPELPLADVAYTLQVGRQAFAHRRICVCRDTNDAVAALEQPSAACLPDGFHEGISPPVVFLFAGHGAQSVNMASGLYRDEPVFREHVDRCAEILGPLLGYDLREVLFPKGDPDAATAMLQNTDTAQLALFTIEYALARLWMAWGIRPHAMLGHSMGEYVAACLANVFSLQDALGLVAAYGRLVADIPPGAMLAVSMTEDQLLPLLSEPLGLAAVNSPKKCVVSGPVDAIESLRQRLAGQRVPCHALDVPRAFHSWMMDAILPAYRECLEQVELRPPEIPYISSPTGDYIRAYEAVDPEHWVRHVRRPVRFADGVGRLVGKPRLFLEVGPGTALSTFVRQHPNRAEEVRVVASLPHATAAGDDSESLQRAVGQLWLAGREPDFAAMHAGTRRRRVALPTYPFERKRYWADANPYDAPQGGRKTSASLNKKPDLADWFYLPAWNREALPPGTPSPDADDTASRWLFFVDEGRLATRLVERLEAEGRRCIAVRIGERFEQVDQRTFRIVPACAEDYQTLFDTLAAQGPLPDRLVHLWTAPSPEHTENAELDASTVATWQDRAFFSLMHLAQAIGSQRFDGNVRLDLVTAGVHDVTGNEQLCPENATILGPSLVIPREYPQVICRCLDMDPRDIGDASDATLGQILAELRAETDIPLVAYRGGYRWVQGLQPIRVEPPANGAASLRERGVYLITGGLGGIGLRLAAFLAETARARLVLLSRSGLPDRTQWESYLAEKPDDDPTGRKIRKMLDFEQRGAEVMVLRADITEPTAMRQAVAQAVERFGTIHGVIHAAGLPGGGIMQLKSREAAARVLRPKIQGTLALADALQDISLDFFTLCSTNYSIVGVFGQVDYAAANAFLNAFAHAASRRGRPTTSILWDAWNDVGMAAKEAAPAADHGGEDGNGTIGGNGQTASDVGSLGTNHDAAAVANRHVAFDGMEPEQGIDIFRRLMATSLGPQVSICVRDLPALIEYGATLAAGEELRQDKPGAKKQPRPATTAPYTAPRNDLEQRLAAIWQEALGIEKVGIHDNFLELGGDSVLAITVLTKANSAGIAISPSQMFEHQTIAEQSTLVAGSPRTAAADVSADEDADANTAASDSPQETHDHDDFYTDDNRDQIASALRRSIDHV